MEWFPMWVETLDKRKVQSLSGDVFKVWANLLMLATKLDQDGALPSISDIAYALRITDEQVSIAIEKLVEVKLVDRSKSLLRIHDFEEWQLPSYSSRERTRAWRERQRDVTVTSQDVDETSLETSRDVTCDDVEREKERTPPLTSKSTYSTGHPPRGGCVLEFVLPDWIPKQDWNDWMQTRLRIKKPATIRAKQLAVSTLAKLKGEGFEPGAVLQQSIMHSWQGLFPIQVPYGANGKPAQQSSKPKPIVTPEEEERINARFK